MSIHSRNGKNAVTHYQVLKRFGDYTYIRCRLETGRTHQIRVHMASIGHPLLGDQVYGPKNVPSRSCRDRLSMRGFWALSIRQLENILKSKLLYHNILWNY